MYLFTDLRLHDNTRASTISGDQWEWNIRRLVFSKSPPRCETNLLDWKRSETLLEWAASWLLFAAKQDEWAESDEAESQLLFLRIESNRSSPLQSHLQTNSETIE